MESRANIGQAGLRPWDLLLPGALGHDRLLEKAFLFLRSVQWRVRPQREHLTIRGQRQQPLKSCHTNRPEGVAHFVWSLQILEIQYVAKIMIELWAFLRFLTHYKFVLMGTDEHKVAQKENGLGVFDILNNKINIWKVLRISVHATLWDLNYRHCSRR